MIALQRFVDQPEVIKKSLSDRGASPDVVDQIIQQNNSRKSLLMKVEQSKARRNKVGEEVAKLKQSKQDASGLLAEMKQLADDSKVWEAELAQIQSALDLLLLTIPNVIHSTVPFGRGSDDNVMVSSWGQIKDFAFTPKDHVDLGEGLKIFDFQRGAKLSGARFCVSYGAAAKLERALISWMLDVQISAGYKEVAPPFLVNRASMIATGQLPKSAEDMFFVPQSDHFLIPTAEVPVTNLHRDEILDQSDLTLKYCAHTPCFRAEAGSYGIDTRGLIRQHQFNKIELVKFTLPEQSHEEHEWLTKDACRILEMLELPYRVMTLCSGDISFGAAKCYDIEVWLPGQQKYREISSCSNFEEFQARRGNIRFRRKDTGKLEFVHTLNGSGLAVGRTVVAILENYQQADGSVLVPKVLQQLMGCERISS